MKENSKDINTITSENGLSTPYEHKSFAINSVIPNNVTKSLTQKTTNKKQVRGYTSSPYSNVVAIQKVSRSTKLVDGIYSRLINYFANMYTYDYLIYPKEVKGDVKKSFMVAAKKLDRYRIKSNLS